ncbi:MAG: hypothetical protein WEA81_01615 [Dehalococcoidia bacterium]
MSVRTVLVGGIVASLVIAMWEMIVEGVLPGGAGFFGPPIAIGASVVRELQGSPNPIPFDLAALVLGLAGHMMNSVILAAAFGVAVGRRGLGTSTLVAAGIVWGVLVFAAMWFVIVPAVDPLVLNLNWIAFLVGHVMWGAALGLLWSRSSATDRLYALRPA